MCKNSVLHLLNMDAVFHPLVPSLTNAASCRRTANSYNAQHHPRALQHGCPGLGCPWLKKKGSSRRKVLASRAQCSSTLFGVASGMSTGEEDVSMVSKGVDARSGRQHGGRDEGLDSLPSMAEILAAAEEKGARLELKSLGPGFSIQAWSLDGGDLGRAQGFVLPWLGGRILHLESIRLTKLSARRRSSLLGVGLFVGAVALRHGVDCSCVKAELLAINDSPKYHAKLVRYYSWLGFRPVHEVTGGRLQDLPHLLVWGGVGTRMDANPHDLLRKWAGSLRPRDSRTS